MADSIDKIFIFFLILFEIILIVAFIINAYYFSIIKTSDSSGVSSGTSSNMISLSILIVFLLFFCLIATFIFLKNEMSRSSEIDELKQDTKIIKLENEDPNIPKINSLIKTLSRKQKEISVKNKTIEMQQIKIFDDENELETMNDVIKTKTDENERLSQEHQKLSQEHKRLSEEHEKLLDSSSEDDNSTTSSEDNIENILEENQDRLVIPEDADDEDTYDPVNVKQPSVKWNSDDGGSFLEKLLRNN